MKIDNIEVNTYGGSGSAQGLSFLLNKKYKEIYRREQSKYPIPYEKFIGCFLHKYDTMLNSIRKSKGLFEKRDFITIGDLYKKDAFNKLRDSKRIPEELKTYMFSIMTASFRGKILEINNVR